MRFDFDVYSKSVFVNCPFDKEFQSFFDAIVYTVFKCGFRVRCSKEKADSGEVRLHKIMKMIHECKFGIHDISRTELDEINQLPRFNMPLELGIFLGCKEFGNRKTRDKACLIMDNEQYRYQKFLSDISGHDISAHNCNVELLISIVRDWLANVSKKDGIEGSAKIVDSYNKFKTLLPETCQKLGLNQDNIPYVDYIKIVESFAYAEVTTSF